MIVDRILIYRLLFILNSDLVEPSRKHGIITGAIVRELEDEIIHENRKEYRDQTVNVFYCSISLK